MRFLSLIEQSEIINKLINIAKEGRVSHAQLFVGKDGYGTLPLALAFAKEILKKENEHSSTKVDSLNHLDLHFSFPVFKANKSGLTGQFFDTFRDMILDNSYSNTEDWSTILESENKQLSIYVEEIDEIIKKFALKSYEGGSKILIVWQADKMNTDAANKFLKFLEEPPKNTYIILTASNIDFMLPTILSRTQIVEIPSINEEDLESFLSKNDQVSEERRKEIIFQAQGNWNVAQKLINSVNTDSDFEEQFIMWVREAFQVKKKPEFLKNIVLWGRRISTWNKEKQLNFLEYCTEMFRLALLQNYGNQSLVYKKIESGGFKWDSFSKFIHGANIEAILEEISAANYHLERNGNAKIIWTDLGIKLSRYLHKKP